MFSFKHYKYFIAIITLIVAEVSLVGGIGIWREYFWGAIEHKDLHQFFILLSYFAVAALGACLISGYNQYLTNYVGLLMRSDLTHTSLITSDKNGLEGFEQRVQEDCFKYPQLGVGLLMTVLRSVLILFVFVGIVTYQVGIIYLLLPTLYVIVGTIVAYKFAKPLIDLNYINQVVEAQFRRLLTKLGLGHEEGYSELYEQVFDNNHKIFKQTKKLAYFQSFYNQVTVLVPYILLSGVYFSGKIVFGVFMQVAASMGHIIDSMSVLINAFNDINNFLSCRKRLKELKII